MLKACHVTAKLGNMRKEARFIVYPRPTNVGDDYKDITIQSDKRICRFNPETRKGLLSSGKGGHPGFHTLHPALGAMEVEIPQTLIDEILAHQPKKGDEVAPGLLIG